MALDFFAIASNGGFPTPTPAAAARMSFIATWGWFGDAPLSAGDYHRWPTVMGWPWRKIWKSWG